MNPLDSLTLFDSLSQSYDPRSDHTKRHKLIGATKGKLRWYAISLDPFTQNFRFGFWPRHSSGKIPPAPPFERSLPS